MLKRIVNLLACWKGNLDDVLLFGVQFLHASCGPLGENALCWI